MNFLRRIKNKLEAGKGFSALFDALASFSIYRKFIYWKIRRYVKKIKKTRRYNIIIETTNLCNARCAMCPHAKMQRTSEVMSDSVFEKIISGLKSDKINPLVFILNGFGEPFTDKKIFNRIRTLKKEFPSSKLKFYSNLNLVDSGAVEKIISSGLDEINVSFNGYSKDSYENIMGINYERTLANLERLIEEKKSKRSSLKIRISMTLVSQNDGDEKKFIKKWGDKVDSVSVNKVHSYNNSVADVAGNNKINFSKAVYPCKYIWNTIVFGVKGELFLCCLDYEEKFNYGNIATEGVLEAFYSDAFEKVREHHLKGEIEKIGICAKCYTPYRNGIEWLINDLY